MNWSELLNAGVAGGASYLTAKEQTAAQKAAANAQTAAAKAQVGVAQANSAWTKYIPLGIIGLVIAVGAFVFLRKK